MNKNFLNPLDWITNAQTWFSRTERSSGFRPYLIFLLLIFGFCLTILGAFPNNPSLQTLAINIIYISVFGFVIIFLIKAFTDSNFCRSEKHIENVKRIELSEQKGDSGPRIILSETTVATINTKKAKEIQE